MTEKLPDVALFATAGMKDFLASALNGMARCGIDGGRVTVGYPAGQQVGLVDIAESFGAKVRPMEPFRDEAVPMSTLEFGSLSFDEAMWLKIRLVRALLEEHERVIYADLDIAWLRDPSYYLQSVLDAYPMAFQSEAQGVFPPAVCAGFMAFRRSDRSRAFLDSMISEDDLRRRDGRRVADQQVAQHLLDTDASWLGDTFFLPEMLFPNGLGLPLFDPQQLKTELTGRVEPFIFHANWMVGADAKRSVLQTFGAWVEVDAPNSTEVSAPTMSVILPLFDLRGSAAKAVALWTKRQIVDAERYKVVVVAGPESDSDIPAVRSQLRPQDSLIELSTPGSEVDYWLAGSRLTSSLWLLHVEGHARPLPDCIEKLLAWIDEHPETAAINCRVMNPVKHTVSPLMRTWFTDTQAAWSSEDTWPRLHRTAFAIRRDVLQKVGNLHPKYGQFAPPLLSAQLHEAGVPIKTVTESRVEHEDSKMSGHRADTANYVRGQLLAHAEQPPDFMSAYFGAPAEDRLSMLDDNHTRSATVGAVKAFMRGRRRGVHAWLAAFVTLAPRAIIGSRARVIAGRYRAFMTGWIIENTPIPQSVRMRLFIGDHERLVRTEQLAWYETHSRHFTALSPDDGVVLINSLHTGTMVGLHDIERHEGIVFRWSEPVLLVRLTLTPGSWWVQLDSFSARAPIDVHHVIATLDGSPVDQIVTREGHLACRFNSAREGVHELMIFLPPLREPGRRGRWLGLPVSGVSVKPMSESVSLI